MIGDGNFSSQCIYTLKDGKIYQGDSTSTFDLLMSYELDSKYTIEYIVMLILPY
jgi:hypothetical protein